MLFIVKRSGIWNKGRLCSEGDSVDLDPKRDAAIIAEGDVASAEQLKADADAKAEEAALAKKKADALAEIDAKRAADLVAKAEAAEKKSKGGAK